MLPEQSASLDDALDELWMDPDPDTAGWVLMFDRQNRPEVVTSRLQSERTRSGTSKFLDSQLRGEINFPMSELGFLANSTLFRDLRPSELLWVAEQGWLKSWSAGDEINRENLMLLILRGGATEITKSRKVIKHNVGSILGAMDVISGESSTSKLQASSDGLHVFAFPVNSFDDLVKRPTDFSHSIMRQLAKRVN